MMTLDLNLIRPQFTALDRPEVFFDNPGGTQIVQSSVERIVRYFKECNANHGGHFATSRVSDALIDSARAEMADFLNAPSRNEIIFGPNMTSLTFSMSRSLGRTFNAGETILVTRMDHDANISPWLMMAEDRGLKVRWVDFHPEDGTLDIEDFQAALEEKPRLAAFECASNLLGTINPVEKLTRMAHEAGALVYIDAVQYVPHSPVDVQRIGCDFLACSSYKFYGPHLGILYGRNELLESLQAYKVRPAPKETPGKFETGTGNFEHIAGLSGALSYFEWIGHTFGGEQAELYSENYKGRRLVYKAAMGALHAYNFELDRMLLDVLSAIPGLKIYGITDKLKLEQRLPTFSFRLEGISPADTASELDKRGIFVWDGNFYALAVTERLGLESKGGVVRVGAVHYNTAGEIHRLGDALLEIARDAKRK